MISQLHKRWVRTAMIAETILLIALILAINLINTWFTSRGTLEMLDSIVQREWEDSEKASDASTVSPPPPPTQEDRRMESVYFVVVYGADDTVQELRLDHIASVGKEEALRYASAVLEKKDSSGGYRQFLYRFTEQNDREERILVFLDITTQIWDVLRLAGLSLIIGGIGWFGMLALILVFSRKALQPVILSIENQRRFVTDAGHELKTPLAIILANTEAMELREGSTKWSRNIREQTLRLNGLMETLLTLSKADELLIKLTRESCDLTDLLDAALSCFAEAAHLKNLHIETDLAPSVTVEASREQIQRLFSILVENAVKYSPKGGNLLVHLKKEGRHAQLRIENSCDSLPSCQPERLFDRFYRADEARSRKSGGYGIGLASARAIVEAHGGKIQARYKNGSSPTVEFSVWL